MQARELEGQSRSDLIARAEASGVEKASLLTRAELVDEIVRRTVVDPVERRIARGLLGLARDLVARVVERGLHLPEAAAKIRSISVEAPVAAVKPPIATVTLAEIYAAQGHRARALRVLEEVLADEPDHAAARQLHDSIVGFVGHDVAVAAPESGPTVAASEEPSQLFGAEAVDAGASSLDSVTHPDDVPALSPVSNDTEGAPPGPLSGMLDDAPLPDRYDVDEVVLMPVDPTTVFVYWEMRETTLRRVREERPAGTLVMRIIAVSASWSGPRVETRDLETERTLGEWFVRDLPVGAVLRAAIGWRAGGQFDPLSVAMETSSPVGDPPADEGHELARYTSEAMLTARSRAVDAEAIDQARERARLRVAEAAWRQGASSWITLPVASPGLHDLPPVSSSSYMVET